MPIVYIQQPKTIPLSLEVAQAVFLATKSPTAKARGPSAKAADITCCVDVDGTTPSRQQWQQNLKCLSYFLVEAFPPSPFSGLGNLI